MTLPDFLTADRYGGIHLTGHRITLTHVVRLYRDGFSDTMIAGYFPTLSLDLIWRVLAYYEANAAEIDAVVAAETAREDELAARPQPGPSLEELRRRMAARVPKGA